MNILDQCECQLFHMGNIAIEIINYYFLQFWLALKLKLSAVEIRSFDIW